MSRLRRFSELIGLTAPPGQAPTPRWQVFVMVGAVVAVVTLMGVLVG